MMKRKAIALLTATAMIASMAAGCGGNGGGNKATTAPAGGGSSDSGLTTENITLKVWESTAGPDEFIKQAGEKFTEKYPNIKIEFVNVELGDSTSQIALDGPAGVGPDLFAAPHDKLGELVTGGHVLATQNSDVVKEEVLGCLQYSADI